MREDIIGELPWITISDRSYGQAAIARNELDEWARQIKELAASANVWCKLSGLVTEANWANWSVADLKPFVNTALEYFGPQRMMFGSDWPVCLLAASYHRVLEAFQYLLVELSDEDRNRIFAGNANEFYQLQPQDSLSLWERVGVRA